MVICWCMSSFASLEVEDRELYVPIYDFDGSIISIVPESVYNNARQKYQGVFGTDSLQAICRPVDFWPHIGEKSMLCDLGYPDRIVGRIGFINGINTDKKRAKKNAEMLSNMAGKTNIYYIYNATHGYFFDVPESLIGLLKISTRPSKLLIKQWKAFFERDKENCFLEICHSQGSIHVRNALATLGADERKRIIVVAIAPAAYITKDLCYKCYHYVSKRDIIPSFDYVGKSKCDEIHILEPQKDSPWWDHDFDSPTYRQIIEQHIIDYIKHPKG